VQHELLRRIYYGTQLFQKKDNTVMMKRITLITGFEDRLRKMLQSPPEV
jgi:hypothetical protein